jgi:magnesium-transporting ATPase (P-type)
VPLAIRRCREAGIRVILATGDHPRTAVAIAREIGLVCGEQPLVLTGEALRKLSAIQWACPKFCVNGFVFKVLVSAPQKGL